MKLRNTLLVLFITLLMMPIFVKAENDSTKNIKIESIELVGKSDNAEVKSEASISDNIINLDLKLYDPKDYVEYSIKIKNISEEEYYFNEPTLKLDKEYITYEFNIDGDKTIKPNEEKVIKFKIIYREKVPETVLVNDSFSTTGSISIVLTTKDSEIVPDIINPETGLINPIYYAVVLVISGTMLLVLFKVNKKYKLMSILVGALIIVPVYTHAALKFDIDINANIEIDGKEAYFLPGQDVNIKMKELAGTDTSTDGWYTANSNITKILHSLSKPSTANMEDKNIVSTSDSPYPIYVWFDNGTIYWWSEDLTPNMNQDSSYMFSYLQKVSNMDGLLNFDSISVTNARSIFYTDISLTNLDFLRNWDTSNVISLAGTFANEISGSKLSDIKGLSNWNVSKVTDMTAIFQLCTSLEYIDGLENWDVSNVESFIQAFAGYKTIETMSIKSLKPLKNWDTSSASNFQGMFQANASLENVDGLENWNVSNVINMSYMFTNNLKLYDISALSNWDVSNVESMQSMFNGPNKIESIKALSDWNVSKVKYMNSMFASNINLKSTSGVEKWKLTSAENIRNLFSGNTSLAEADLSNWSIDNVSNMYALFSGDTNLKSLKISNINTSNVTNIDYAFSQLTSLEEIDLSDLDLSNATTIKNMLGGSSVQRIKTPKTYPTNVSKKINLPGTFCDEDDNHYTQLDNTSPTQTWLTKCE